MIALLKEMLEKLYSVSLCLSSSFNFSRGDDKKGEIEVGEMLCYFLNSTPPHSTFHVLLFFQEVIIGKVKYK